MNLEPFLNTAQLLKDNWQKFHLEKLDKPDDKYVQLCYSQGAIHVKNALKDMSQDIQDRVIVIGIAPGAIISEKMCFSAINFASENDFVPKGESIHSNMTYGLIKILYNKGSPQHTIATQKIRQATEEAQSVIRLKPHPEEKGRGHYFTNPTLQQKLEETLNDILNSNPENK